MLNQDHPSDERLSALASRDDDAVADTALTSHVGACNRCTALVSELGALRVVLADLPDLRPSRPLQLLPPVAPAPSSGVDRLGGWARRFFAPAMAAGAALALVGTVGTAAPALDSSASGPEPVTQESDLDRGAAEAQASEEAAQGSDAEAAASDVEEPASEGAGGAAGEEGATTDQFGDPSQREIAASPSVAAFAAPSAGDDDGRVAGADEGGQLTDAAPTSERSPWPMVLFAGVAVMVGALLFRWVLAPRP